MKNAKNRDLARREHADRRRIQRGQTGQTRSPRRAQPSEPISTALIVATANERRNSLAGRVAAVGRQSITVHHPLEVIHCLQDDSLAVDLVLAPAHDIGFGTHALFAFMRDEFPRVRRIAYVMSTAGPSDAPETGQHDRTRSCSAPLRRFPGATQPSPVVVRLVAGYSVVPTTDRRSNEQLLHAWNGSDREAFDELDRRFRPRIRAYATSLRFTEEDVEDIVQETLLALFVSRGMFRGNRTPDDFLFGLAATSVTALERGMRRRGRLRAAVAHAAVVHRSERERRGQPDARLRAVGLVSGPHPPPGGVDKR